MSKSIWDDKEIQEFIKLLSAPEIDADPYCERSKTIYRKVADKFPWEKRETKEQKEIRELRDIILKLVQNNTKIRDVLKDLLLTIGNVLRYVECDESDIDTSNALKKLSEKITEIQELLKEKQE